MEQNHKEMLIPAQLSKPKQVKHPDKGVLGFKIKLLSGMLPFHFGSAVAPNMLRWMLEQKTQAVTKGSTQSNYQQHRKRVEVC